MFGATRHKSSTEGGGISPKISSSPSPPSRVLNILLPWQSSLKFVLPETPQDPTHVPPARDTEEEQGNLTEVLAGHGKTPLMLQYLQGAS